MVNLLIYSSFFVLPLLASVKVIFQGKLMKKTTDTPVDTAIILNGWIFTFSFLVLACIFVRALPTTDILLYALGFGAFQVVFQVAYVMAFSEGSVALSSIIVSLSVAIPMLFGILVYHEEVSMLNVIGMVLLVIPIVLIPKEAGKKRVNLKWVVYISITAIASGILNCLLIYATKTGYNSSQTREMLIYGYLIAGIALFAISALKGKKPVYKDEKYGKFILIIIIVAVSLGLYNTFLATALQTINSSILYPVVNVLTIVFMVISDYILYKQKLSSKQKIGVIFAIICVILLNI